MLPIQRGSVYPSLDFGGSQKELDEFVQRVKDVLTFDSDIYWTPSDCTQFAQQYITGKAATTWHAYCK
jgi:hypothetical protein